MRARLFAKSGIDSGESFVLTGDETLIGRAETCSIRIADAQASRQHCAIRKTPEGYRLIDLESRNGTAVNGLPVTDRLLRVGDEIRVGHTVFVFFEDAERERAAPRPSPEPPDGGYAPTILLQRPPQAGGPDAPPAPSRAGDTAGRARAILTEIAALLRAGPGRAAFLDKLLKILFQALPAVRGTVLVLEPGSARVLEEAERRRDGAPDAGPLVLGQEVLDAVTRRGHSALARSESGGQDASLLAVPLGPPRAVRGVIALAAEPGTVFTEEDLDLAEAAGALAGSALDALERLAAAEEDRAALRRAMAGGHDLVGTSPPMRAVYEQIAKAAPTEATVLLRGESGTGKELVARALHANSPRARGPFIACNCGAIPEGLAESELFGHEKGSFTGAAARRQGLFEQAHTGTLFLDEIGELDLKCQVRLLRVLESRTLRRVGGTEDIAVDVRFLAATNRDLSALVRDGRFREDLLYRLQVLEIALPPLRRRKEDILPLAAFFLDRLRKQVGRRVEGIAPEALERLKAHDWPGNVRELRNCIERAVILGSGPLIREDEIVLPSGIPGGAVPGAPTAPGGILPLREVERRAIAEALERCGWNRSAAAEKLGIQRSTLYEKIKAYGIRAPEDRAP